MSDIATPSGLRERFARFFRAFNGSDPYPWQTMLAEHIACCGRWPSDIVAPTGAGKSSVVDVHVFLNAEYLAGRLERRPPRRLVLVSPRRVLVDDQYERALRLAAALAGALETQTNGPLREVALALRQGVSARAPAMEGPLLVWRLRGGIDSENGWRLDPSVCQVIAATPLMWGSRLLFRGFGTSARARNWETGLIAHDAVAVIDEAHLHTRLVDSARLAARQARTRAGLQVTAMSATPAQAIDQPPREGPDAITYTNEDLAIEAFRRRVDARKPVEVVELAKGDKIPEAVAREAANQRARLLQRFAEQSAPGNDGHDAQPGDKPLTVAVFVNTVNDALEVASLLEKKGDGEVVVVCGQMRPADVDRLREEYPGLLTPRGDERVAYLVSTQSLEVGVDLDVPAMVSVLASAPALSQRVGRLNRTGRWDDVATLVVIVPPDLEKAKDNKIEGAGPYDRDELTKAREWLSDKLGARHGTGNASPRAIAESGLASYSKAPRADLPPLTPVELDTWAMTSIALSADPDPELYVSEPSEFEQPEVSVAARKDLDLETEVVAKALQECPPRDHEIANLPIWAAQDLVKRLGDSKAVDRVWILRQEEGSLRAVSLDLRSSDGNGKNREARDPSRSIRPGDAVVLPAGAPVMTGRVLGLGRSARRPAGGKIDDVLERSPEGRARDWIVRVPAGAMAPIVEADPELGTRAARRALAEQLRSMDQQELAKVVAERPLRDLALSWCEPLEGEHGLLVISETRTRAPIVVKAQRQDPVLVDTHQERVARRLQEILGALARHDFASELVGSEDVLEGVGGDDRQLREALIAAARLHDEGKRHPRFQARMGNPDPTIAVAKPLPGAPNDRGDGWRHEQLSAAVARARGHSALPVVLIAAHHGRGRPLFDRLAEQLVEGWEGIPADVVAAAEQLFGPSGTYELERERLHRQLGVHALAYLEALLRCADSQISREEVEAPEGVSG